MFVARLNICLLFWDNLFIDAKCSIFEHEMFLGRFFCLSLSLPGKSNLSKRSILTCLNPAVHAISFLCSFFIMQGEFQGEKQLHAEVQHGPCYCTCWCSCSLSLCTAICMIKPRVVQGVLSRMHIKAAKINYFLQNQKVFWEKQLHSEGQYGPCYCSGWSSCGLSLCTDFCTIKPQVGQGVLSRMHSKAAKFNYLLQNLPVYTIQGEFFLKKCNVNHSTALL